MIECRRCGAQIDTRYREEDGSVVCPKCGAIYRPRVKSQAADKSHSEGKSSYRQPQKTSGYRDEFENKPPKKKRRKRRKRRIITAILIVLFAALLAIVGLFAYNNLSKPTGTPTSSPTPSPDGTAIPQEQFLGETADAANDPLVTQELQIFQSDPASFVTDQETGISFVNNELLIVANTGVDPTEVQSFVTAHNGRIVGYNSYLNQYQVQLGANYDSLDSLNALVAEFERSELFRTCYPNYIIYDDAESFYPNDSEWTDWNSTGSKHWGADAMHLPEMWELFQQRDHKTVNVGIIDSKFKTNHEDLVFSGTYLNSYRQILQFDQHGTHIAGIIGATQNNGKGISGVAPDVRLYGFSKEGFGEGTPALMIQAGLTYLICHENCKVINYSQGFGADIKYYNLFSDCSQEQYENGEFYEGLGN